MHPFSPSFMEIRLTVHSRIYFKTVYPSKVTPIPLVFNVLSYSYMEYPSLTNKINNRLMVYAD